VVNNVTHCLHDVPDLFLWVKADELGSICLTGQKESEEVMAE
jgi:hypothetical protein